ncbi:MAG: cyclic lactone autoinducer peptide [Clostridia bacterium]
MVRFKNFVFKCASTLCMIAMFLAVHSVNVLCAGKYYQPKVPKELDKFRKN